MPTVTQIIAYADRYYPNDATDANCIIDIDTIHKAVYNKIIRLKNIYKDETSLTVADQLTYTLPTDCLPENIIRIEVSDTATGSITSSTIWQEYERATLSQDISYGYYWHNLNDTTIILSCDGAAITASNYEIRYFYYPNPVSITAVTDTPMLDAEYHDLLYYGLIQYIASQGANPDVYVANYYQQKFDERFEQIKKALAERYDSAPIEDCQLGSRWG